jgi:Holliday junction resolvase RusA-like endonuclease
VKIEVILAWPYRKGEPEKNRTDCGIPHVSKPDISNLMKTLEDRLVEEGFIRDDAEIADSHTFKKWSDIGYFAIRIVEIESPLRKVK